MDIPGSSMLGVSFAFAGVSVSDPFPHVRESLRQPGHQFLLVCSCWLNDFSSVGVGQSACLSTRTFERRRVTGSFSFRDQLALFFARPRSCGQALDGRSRVVCGVCRVVIPFHHHHIATARSMP